MSVLRLIVREMAHRKLNALLGIIAVAVSVALVVGTTALCSALKTETVRLMRDMGFNLIVLPSGADMARFWSEDFAREDMPEDYVYTLANAPILTVRHLVARLQKKVQWRGRTVLLTGLLPEVPMAHRSKKSPMGMSVPRGEAYVGYELVRGLNLKPGDVITLQGAVARQLTVSRCLETPSGSKDDIRIYTHLHDAQEILGMPGRINAIEALNCLCVDAANEEGLRRVQADVQAALPGTQVTLVRNIAVARQRTRRMIERYAGMVLPAVALVCAIWVGLLALVNVRDRRSEIGVLRALGVSSAKVAALFIGRAALLGLAGAAAGFVLGTALAAWMGPQLFPRTVQHIGPDLSVFGWSVIGAALLCMVASYVPALVAVSQDPADVLGQE